MSAVLNQVNKSLPKKAQLRVIDQGTNYDVPGRLKALARAIERGDYGRVTDVGIVLKSFQGCQSHMVCTRAGTGTPGDFLMMANHLQAKASQ